MVVGQTLILVASGMDYEVEEVRDCQAIARSPRTGNRIMLTEHGGGVWGQFVTDNGRAGSLFDCLVPHGPGYVMTVAPR